MKQTLTLVLPPEIAFDEQNLLDFLSKKLNFQTNTSENTENIPHIRLLRRSVDARSREIKVNIEVEVSQNEPLTGRSGKKYDRDHMGYTQKVTNFLRT